MFFDNNVQSNISCIVSSVVKKGSKAYIYNTLPAYHFHVKTDFCIAGNNIMLFVSINKYPIQVFLRSQKCVTS